MFYLKLKVAAATIVVGLGVIALANIVANRKVTYKRVDVYHHKSR